MVYCGENNPNYKHGLTNGNKFRHPVYTSWQNMKQRCYNKNNPKFHCYGGRNISVCEQWLNSKNFVEWAFTSGWQKGLTLDRKDNNGNYEPENCQWILHSLNSRKKRTTKLTIEKANQIRKRCENGESESKLAEEFDVCQGTIWFIRNELTWNS